MTNRRFIHHIGPAFIGIFIVGVSAAQTPKERYRTAHAVLKAHSLSEGFINDDSTEAVGALSDMWHADADTVIDLLARNSEATPKEINKTLCELNEIPGECVNEEGPLSSVLALGSHLFAIAQFTGEVGTVFIIGRRDGKPVQLWSLADLESEKGDPHDLLGAWKVTRAGGKCRESSSIHKPGSCGPLYAGLGLLTPDTEGRPRFYIAAGYAQIIGSTIGKQTSVWRWDGDQARLLWIDWYDFMIDQKNGDSYKDGVLSFGEKEEFRSFYSCGSCEGRQMVQQLKVAPRTVEDLGKRSTMPELDLIDELFWRLSNKQSTVDIADPRVSELLKPQIASAKQEAQKINANYFTVGMLDTTSIEKYAEGEHVCFTVDGDMGRLYFTILTVQGHPARITHVAQPGDATQDCSS